MTDEISDLELTPELGKFVELVARGYDPADAAALAGYERDDARRMIRHARVSAAIRVETQRLAQSRLVPLSLRAVTRMLEDPTTPPVLLARVALGVLSYAGTMRAAPEGDPETGGEEDDPLTQVDVSAMTPAQLSEAKANINQLLILPAPVASPIRRTRQGA